MSQVVVDYKTTEYLAACQLTVTSWLVEVTMAEATVLLGLPVLMCSLIFAFTT